MIHERSPLGYAKKFVELPRLKNKHKPRGTNKTPPSLKGAIYVRGKRYNFGYRILTDGNFEIVHVEGAVYPHSESNVFEKCYNGVSNFILFMQEKEENEKVNK